MLHANYMEAFKCIGSECPDSCCQGWRVSVGQKTYKKYKKSHHPKLKVAFQNNLAKTKKSSRSESNFAYIKLNDNNACPFLSSDALCSIQNNLGQKFLSQTCNTYPREYNLIDGTLEKSATLSCPEAARLALLQKKGISFNKIPDDDYSNGRLAIGKTLNTQSPSSQNNLTPYFWELHLFSIEMMQNRKFKIWQRLLTLGFMSRKTSELIKNGQRKSIPEIIAQYRHQIDTADTTLYEDEIPVKHNTQLSLIRVLLKDSIIKDLKNNRFLECHQLFLKGISADKHSDNKIILDNYTHAYTNFYAPFMEKHSYILENYLVNYIFKSLFPVSQTIDAQQAYATMVVNYTIIRSYLVGMAGALKEEFNIQHVVMLIQSFSKVIEHNKTYMHSIREFLHDNQFDQLAHMAVLLRNEEKAALPPLLIAI